MSHLFKKSIRLYHNYILFSAMFLLLALVSSVKKMSEDIFEQNIKNGNGKTPYFVMFTDNDSHACHHAYKNFKKTELQANGIAEFYTIDSEECPNLTSHYEIQYFPTFGLFFRRQEIQFYGKFEIPSFTKFLIEQISLLLLPINTSWANNGRKQVIYFINRRIPPPYLAAAFGKYYKYDIDFAMNGNETIINQFPNISVPTWYFTDGEKNMTIDVINNIPFLYKTINEFFNIQEKEEPIQEPSKKKYNYNDL